MTRIYTRSGDQGESGLANGQRISKTDLLFEAIGDVDELNAQLGMIRALNSSEAVDKQLSKIQHKLFDLGAQVAQYKGNNVDAADIVNLEQWIDHWQQQLAPLKQFILPAGSQSGCAAHLARSTCRRAERKAWQAANNHEIESEVTQYLNRLSDYLFVLARVLNGGDEVFWQSE
ncbi:cob(I)yrinic acid a,c-diamide adenosyltransferase [Marinicella litoralis]|uniref:Corrinoid adenosyltransferase n=1 Tax=Marinicella litoralis TaxID=644220 RepID=A0A4R6XPQ4_9GAMM|nr:cob(I)yrinic acid a,c-diamide adenosyltransferase [Marinicella litoralis]TDR19313.1 ATP:cob(I)alamin adenosyltransferase [Marinicella litoralis]